MMFNLIPLIYAAPPPWEGLEGAQGGEKDVATIASLTSLFQNAVTGITAFAGVVLFIVLISAGFTFLFSGGDAKKLEKAKNTFTYALIGMVVIISAYLIIQLIQTFTGANVTEFNLNIGK